MQHFKSTLNEHYGHRLRVRVCGIMIHNNEVLMVQHNGLRETGQFWSAPGGGLEFGETMEQCLKREFLEETGLEVKVESFYCHYEFLQLPLHAIELYFKVSEVGGRLKTGSDPETPGLKVINAVEWIAFDELRKFPQNTVHPILFELLKNKSGDSALRL